jgi:2-amino-4-hydroxy-6-hydroxymethyldihydropteridine diphosphokinase
MSRPHKFYLSLGSNVEPESNLAKAIHRLREHGWLEEISSVWESPAVDAWGPNFLNVCASYAVGLGRKDLKAKILRPVETALGRVRGHDKNAPRTIDIDIIMMDGRPLNAHRWVRAFVLLPMAELLPGFKDPATGKLLTELAAQSQAPAWILRRPRVPRNNQPAA